MREKLVAAAAAAAQADARQQGLHDILAGLEAGLAPADQVARSRFFEPLAILTGDPAQVPPSRAYFTPHFLDRIWSWFEDQLGEEFIAWAIADDNLAWHDSWTQRRKQAAQALSDFLDVSANDRKAEARLAALWGAGGAERARDIATLLRSSGEITAALKPFPDEIRDLTPELCTELRDGYERFGDDAPDAGLWLLLIILARLKKTAQIFRAIEKIGRRGDDLLVSKTDLATVGDAVFKDAEHFAALFKHAPDTLDDARVAVDGLANYVSITVGMTREFGIRKDGRWGKQLFGLRSQVSSDLEKIFASVPKALGKAVPEPRKGKGGIMTPVEIAPETVIEQAEARLHFVAGAHEWASQAAVASIHKKTEEAATTLLDDCSSALINLVQHSEGEEQALASQGLDVVARLFEAAGQDENASLIRRRSAAALAA
ncbi:hypothetical protein [Hyphobacterium marinum]|uniref:Uncharacterized protein n=1 Tax=Hyphobacterium marinum TaxID=3116574 RepID=A0ABU7M0T9_9PROT|nr:hypothetical protein [Hyphobacterium sp. Y6023]MEE2567316.1 hypothetical protein [Hyphobacterium sp. Y6023]